MKKWFTLVYFLGYSCFLPAQEVATVSIHNKRGPVISKYIYGHFTEHLGRCIYDGMYRGGSIRMDIVKALQKIKVPVLRWPGGCFADQYHWKDGVGGKRPGRVNVNWGMVKEDNSFGTQEFLSLCHLIGCEPYLAGNVGTGSPQEMKNWVQYVNYDHHYHVSFIGVGNESWDCGGSMTPEYYSNQYKQFASFLPDYPGTHLKKIASGAYNTDYHWTEVCMKNIGAGKLWGISLHYYIFQGSWEHKGSATKFSEEQYFTSVSKALMMDSLIRGHTAIMDTYDPEKKVALVVDEWGIWTDPEPGTNPAFLQQQNSLRDALIAATTLNIFNNHADRVKMACLAQTVNVLQALILTQGNKILLTPTYYVFDLYKVHQDATLLPVQVNSPYYSCNGQNIPAVNVSASKDSNGAVHISFVNLDPVNAITITASLDVPWKTAEGKIITSQKFTDGNTFEKPNTIVPTTFSGARKQGNDLVIELPSKSVVVLELK